MPNPVRSRAEIEQRVAAERRVHGQLLGYQPMRMKPVHFATNFFLALTGRANRLEYLNKAAVPKSVPKDTRSISDEYPAERLLPILVDMGRVDPGVDLDSFRTLQSHLNAAYNNDGSALAAAFPPYKTFGADYSAPSLSYVTSLSKNHGYSGSFVTSIFEASEEGRATLAAIRRLFDLPAPPLAAFGAPLLDAEDDDWLDQHDNLYGPLEPAMAAGISAMMLDCTQAVGRLARNLERLGSNYALRYLVIGLCSWLFTYLMRQSGEQPLLLIDALQGTNLRIRSQSRATYARQLDRFAASYDRAYAGGERGAVESEDWAVFAESADSRQMLDDHFRDLGVRIGVVQPRSAVAKHKHIELQADTVRALALSLLEEDDVLTMPVFADRLLSTWCQCVGAGSEDSQLLRQARFGPLDRDDDLRPNAVNFERFLVRLGLAVEPSDGLTLVALNAGELI
jgi:hypothetical protein